MTHLLASIAVHGMLLVGQSKFYVSHLPMFHSPHDYQIILEVEFDEASKSAYLANKMTSDETVYTVEPEAFDLPKMIQNPKPFQAKIFKGHFERGGKVIAGKVTVNISKVIYFKKFIPGETKPANADFILFGNQNELFLAHSIVAKPDFDQILQIQDLEKYSDLLKDQNSAKIVFKDLPNSPLKVEKTLYLEFGDLSH